MEEEDHGMAAAPPCLTVPPSLAMGDRALRELFIVLGVTPKSPLLAHLISSSSNSTK